MTDFNNLSEKVNFYQEEEKIFEYWNEIDAFKQQLEKTKHYKKYSFYDGPPFATGLPHYGHITAGTIKDIVTRYASQTGHHVERRFGWDCHGLPVEYEIDKTLNLKTKEDHQKMGIKKYNEECKKIVMRYSKEWKHIVQRLGRWIDFDNDYKTMDLKYMESVWWVFKQIFDKGHVYRGCKVMPYSMQCTTVLSNFEAGQNYKDVFDPSVVVNFPLKSDRKTKLLAWTTTPWTLPSNLALAVHPDFIYLKIKDKKWDNKEEGEIWIIAESRLNELYGKVKDKKSAYEIVEKVKGKDLEGLEYEPLFDYFIDRQSDGCFRVLCANYVTSDSGTGIVHQAPAFGEEDYKVCLKNKLIRPDNPPCPIDENGRFTEVIREFQGQHVKEADKEIIKELRNRGRMVQESQVKHSYPYCWRSDTPLIYKAHHSWFIRVTDFKDNLLNNNYKSKWVPQFAQEKRFHNWLQDAQDWCFSRSRMWGNPIPIWVSDDFEEVVCVGSIQELKQLAGISDDTPINDIHRESIDHITIPSKQGKGQLRRVEEVFDCWFESGSMPYAQLNYPFSMDESEFKTRFPADFISEGIDQTRGWFYTLNVIATALFDSNPFKNLIVNGLVLAQDGKKMSKRLQNYPDPMDLVSKTGADAIRLYLVSSPLVKGESLNFKEEGVRDVVKDTFIPWFNAYRFLIQNIKRWEQSNNNLFKFNEYLTQNSKNIMDQWILASTENLIRQVRTNMEKYDLSSSLPKLVQFLYQLTNWYVRLNRQRLKGDLSEQDWLQSLNILYIVILKSAQLMSPFVPFITDIMYQNLRKVLVDDSCLKQQSIHFLQLPDFNQTLINEEIEQNLSNMQQVIEIARNLREKKAINQKQPIQECKIFYKDQKQLDNLKSVEQYLLIEVNCAKVSYSNDISEVVEYSAMPNNQLLGRKLKKAFNKDFIKAVNNLSVEQVNEFINTKKTTVNGIELVEEDLLLKQNLKSASLPDHQIMDIKNDFVVFIDISQDEGLKQQGMRRELINRIQKMRKSAKLDIEDDIYVFYEFNESSEQLRVAYQNGKDEIQQIIKKCIHDKKQLQSHFRIIDSQTFKIDNQEFNIVLTWSNIFFNEDKLQETCKENSEIVKQVIYLHELKDLKKKLQKNNGSISVKINDDKYDLKVGEQLII